MLYLSFFVYFCAKHLSLRKKRTLFLLKITEYHIVNSTIPPQKNSEKYVLTVCLDHIKRTEKMQRAISQIRPKCRNG